MASNLESLIHKGSDLVFDFACFTCQDNARNTEADFYCEECSRFYCSKCVEHHNYLYKKHALSDKTNISQWPETNVDELEKCQEHRKEKLTEFCDDHSQLICHACHMHNHQKCSKVLLIADKMKDHQQKGDFKQLSATVDTQLRLLIQKKDDFEENMTSLEKSYNKILEDINALRKAITDSLDQLEKNTKMKLDALLATMRTSIQTDIDNCMECINNITCLKECWLRSEEKSQAFSLFKYSKCLDQSFKVDEVLQEMTIKVAKTLTFNPDTTIQQTLSTLTGLGKILSTVRQSQLAENKTQNTVTTNKPKASSQSDPGNQTEVLIKSGQVSDPLSSSLQQLILGYQPGAVIKSDKIIIVKSSKKYSVNFKGDKGKCVINDICETASGELLIADFYNEKVKLLDQTYKVVAHYKLDYGPWSLCSIDTNLVAVSMNNPEVNFIRVTNGQLIKDRILKLEHRCRGIAHQNGNLYITDGSALFHYTVDGRLVRKIYADTCTSREFTVTSCAVSPDGDRIYVTNEDSNQLVTLSRDGKLISTLTDAALNHEIQLPSLNVTDSGQVLVCGDWFPTIIQVDRDGSQILDEVITKDDGVTDPTAVYYKCRGIAHQNGNLYITDGSALFHYTVDGRLVRKIYADTCTSREFTVTSCAVSPDGDRIYVTNEDSNQLVTLSRDGKLISTLTDAALNHEIQLPSLNVTDSGQVLVCGDWFPTIIQVDRDGSQILDEVITKDDGVTDPTAVYYSKKKSSIIVGMYWNNDIMVFEAEWQLKKDNVRS